MAAKAEYWDHYYDRQRVDARRLPSQFATFVAGELDDRHRIIEFGCGNGRDSLFFASHGHDVIGIDGSAPAIEHCRTAAERIGEDATFIQSSVTDPGLGSRIPVRETATVVYARFFLHAITEQEEQDFLRLAADLTDTGDLMAVEYRTVRDQRQVKVTEAHYRRFMEAHEFHRIAWEHGFTVSYTVEGFGFAKYRDDDAHVARSLLTRA